MDIRIDPLTSTIFQADFTFSQCLDKEFHEVIVRKDKRSGLPRRRRGKKQWGVPNTPPMGPPGPCRSRESQIQPDSSGTTTPESEPTTIKADPPSHQDSLLIKETVIVSRELRWWPSLCPGFRIWIILPNTNLSGSCVCYETMHQKQTCLKAFGLVEDDAPSVGGVSVEMKESDWVIQNIIVHTHSYH